MCAKHSRQVTAASQGKIARLQQAEVFDDHLLPDAAEIERLTQIDPNIIDWLKDRAVREQDFRHKAYNTRADLIDKHNSKEHNTIRYGLTIYLLLVLGAGLASFILVREGHNLEGSIFGGAAIILALAVLVTRKPPRSPHSTE